MTKDTKLLDQLMQDMERPSYEALYHQLGRLRAEMPHWMQLGQPDASKWIGRALALIEAVPNCTMELVTLRAHLQGFVTRAPDDRVANAIATVIDTAIAKVELKLPAQAQGAFIPAGGAFDGFQAVAKAVGLAKSDVLMVDPYADDTLIADFVPLVPEHVQILVLSDAGTAKPSLRPAAERWIAQYPTRPLEVRLAAARTLHDRIIVTDASVAWVIGQSFKDLAKRAHSSLVRMDPESAALKVSAYKMIWGSSTRVV